MNGSAPRADFRELSEIELIQENVRSHARFRITEEERIYNGVRVIGITRQVKDGSGGWRHAGCLRIDTAIIGKVAESLTWAAEQLAK